MIKKIAVIPVAPGISGISGISGMLIMPVIVALAGFLFFTACASEQKTPWNGEITRYEYEEPFSGNQQPDDEQQNIHVVLIGLDGWGAYYLSKAEMPTVKRMMSEGSSTLKAQSVLPTNSWPNWSSMFLGAPPEIHGYTGGGDGGPFFEGPLRDEFGFFPTIFALVKNRRPEGGIAFFHEWDKIGFLCPPQAAETIEHIADLSANPQALERVVLYITGRKPVFTVIVFNEPDSVGHAKRHGSPEYYATLKELDAHIARVEQAVQAGGFYADTVFILTADHGGWLWGHGFNTPKQRTIPLILYGKNIRRGFVIPGRVNIYDIAPTIAAIFGIDAPPVWTGRALREVLAE
ncbi:MAG: alkaline phosphatase [Treponema sp.]|jgi:predicted AlkP superfamily pyrophosphatase or phosphodiesterase|nr:alkaline phosphatase [Treponema sp.]